MKKFKVGDRVKFEFYGKEVFGKVVEIESGINNDNMLVKVEGNYCEELHDGNGYSKRKYTEKKYWYVSPKNAELAETHKEIHITIDGDTVNGILKENGKVSRRSKAVCSKEESFDFETGAKLAFERLFDEKKEEFKPHIENEYGVSYGEIGKATPMRDSYGKPLFVGDSVIILNSDSAYTATEFVCEDNGDFFVMGIRMDCEKDGRINPDWKVIKNKYFTDIVHGEKIGRLKAVFQEEVQEDEK